MKKIKIIFSILLIFSLTGCFFDIYKNGKYGEEVITSWYSYKNGEDNLGAARKKVENIDKISSSECEYIDDDGKNYIYSCEIKYSPIGETIIPLTDEETLNLYVVFIPHLNGTYTYKVYNSSSEKGIWETDKELGWNK